MREARQGDMSNRDPGRCNVAAPGGDDASMVGHGQIAPTDIRALVTTSDGGRFIIGAEDGSIRLLATDPLNRLHSARAHPGGVLTLGIVERETETLVFSSGEDCRVRRWRLADDRLFEPADLDALGADNQGHAIAATARWVASAGHDGKLRVYDHEAGRLVVGDMGIQVFAMSASPDGRLLAIGGTDGGRAVAQLWRVNQTQIRRQSTTSLYDCAAIRSVLVVDQRKVVLGGDDAQLVDWNPNSEITIPFGRGHRGPVHALARVDERTIVSGSSDGTVLRWNLTGRTMLDDTGLIFPGGVFALAVPEKSAKPMVFAAGGRGELHVLRAGQPLKRPFSGHTAAVRAISVSEYGDLIVTGSADRTARLWNSSGGDDGVLTGHDSAVSAVATWPGDNSRVITGSEDGTIVVWDRFGHVQDGRPMAHGAQVWALAISPDGKRIFSGGNDRKVKVWHADKRTEIGTPWTGSRKAVSAIAISGNGAYAVIGEDDGHVVFWDLTRDSPSTGRKAVENGQVRSVAIDFEGNVAVVGGQDGDITVWDVRTGTRIGAPISTNHRDVRKVFLSTDGRTIISCGVNGSVERWDRATGGRVGHVRPDFTTGSVEAIALMPDGELIVAGDSDGEIGLVRTAPEATQAWPPGREQAGIVTDPPHPNPTSDEPTTDDTIGNTADVRAIAELIAARHTSAPLSIALLGDWGSGKSSTVLQVENYVHKLARSARQDRATPFWTGNLRQIRFNAWHYSDVELWTGLIEQIIYGLRQPAVESPDEAAAASATEDRDTVRARHEELSRLADEVDREIDDAASARTSLRHPLAALRRGRHLWRAAGKLVDARSVGRQAAAKLDDAKRTGRSHTRALWIIASVLVLVVALVPFVWTWLSEVYAWLSTGVGVVGVAAWLAGLRGFSKRTDNVLQYVTAQATEVRNERDRFAALRGRLEPTYRLRQVLDELGTADAYARHRGVVGSVYKDLRTLAEALAEANKAPNAGTPPVIERVVLYIDDLDRCAPERVMKVLEAVNLLLSMRMFIVVVAVDPRVLCDGLKAVPGYAFGDDGQRHRHVLSLLDKVFNVVYAMRPLGSRRPNYLLSLLHDIDPEPLPEQEPSEQLPNPPARQATADPGAAAPDVLKPLARLYELPDPPAWDAPNRTLRISPGEVELLVSLADLLPGPRAVKKFTNIYRLILADEYHRRTHYLSDGYQAAAIMVAGVVRDPAGFAGLIDHLGAARCTHDGTAQHQDVVELLGAAAGSCAELGAVLGERIARQVREPGPLRCSELYRTWSIRVARYSFETYNRFDPC
ncbi:P-loop NTPase fold protein [Actinophytocola sp.]|uniref:P-loop NTPase fold protein n=1 Tax=Actinophytocola sp. TaxID=1872138 RepID=UPI00389ABDA9